MYFPLSIACFISILSIQSCQTPGLPSGLRKPSATRDLIGPEKSETSYALNIDLEYLRAREKKLQAQFLGKSELFNKQDLDGVKLLISNSEKLQLSQTSIIQNLADNLKLDTPQFQWGDYKRNWRVEREKIVITNPNNYLLKDGKIVRELLLDLSGTTDYQLGFVNKVWVPKLKVFNTHGVTTSEPSKYFEASIKCDGDFKIKKYLFTKAVPKNKNIQFRINEQTGNSPTVLLYLNQKVTTCDVLFNDPMKPEDNYGVHLISNLKDDSHLTEIKNRFETCILPDASELKGVEKLFLTAKYDSMTCPEEVNDIKTLEVPIDGLKSKAETLLGQELPADFITNLNPYGVLDFSKAPKLNTILFSYLVFRHDFYGTVLARLAKWHADHGTKVRILMSDVISNDKDRLMLHGLVESSNNIKVQEFRYDSDGGGLWDHINEFHRTMHVKLMVTLSDNPSDNAVYIGGRNIHDGFVFMKAPDLSAFPELVQYGSQKGSDEGYAPWRDFEMRIRSKNLAEKVASHYMTLWERDSQSFYIRSINQNIVSHTAANPKYFDREENSALIRHFLSIPYKDDDALEKFYIDIFDSAEKNIRLSTPYFRPTKKLGEAMLRAVERGVDISLITRLDLSGDTAAIILGEVNKAGINRFLKKIKMFEYTEPGVILHSKIILVDDKVSFIGSVNLNKRSFIHDIESGLMIYNPAYNKKMHLIMDVYKKQTREITESQKIAFWKKVVIGLLDEEF